MLVTSRPYAGHRDLEELLTFLTDARRSIHEVHALHSGDLVWQVFHMQAAFNPADIVQLWEDEERHIAGFVLLYPAFGFFDLHVQTHQRGSTLEEAMLTWTERQLTALRHSQGDVGAFSTLVHEHDASRIALLEQHGYRQGEPWLYMQRSLAGPLPQAQLPDGFRVRHVQDTSEAEARATVLAAAFAAPVQVERYQQFMQAPGYNIDLDLVAVAPDGQFGAFAMCWLDRVNKVGQFEPVGTAPAFRRLGLGRAVLVEGMHQMQLQGAEDVIVVMEEAEDAARRLYASVGFRPVWKLFVYSGGLSGE